jgi:hypothetical protein
MAIKAVVVSQLIQDYRRLPQICNELQEMLVRECGRHMMDSDYNYQAALEQAIDAINGYLEYEPSDEEMGGEPPMTASEMHSAAWQQHREMHS